MRRKCFSSLVSLFPYQLEVVSVRAREKGGTQERRGANKPLGVLSVIVVELTTLQLPEKR